MTSLYTNNTDPGLVDGVNYATLRRDGSAFTYTTIMPPHTVAEALKRVGIDNALIVRAPGNAFSLSTHVSYKLEIESDLDYIRRRIRNLLQYYEQDRVEVVRHGARYYLEATNIVLPRVVRMVTIIGCTIVETHADKIGFNRRSISTMLFEYPHKPQPGDRVRIRCAHDRHDGATGIIAAIPAYYTGDDHTAGVYRTIVDGATRLFVADELEVLS